MIIKWTFKSTRSQLLLLNTKTIKLSYFFCCIPFHQRNKIIFINFYVIKEYKYFHWYIKQSTIISWNKKISCFIIICSWWRLYFDASSLFGQIFNYESWNNTLLLSTFKIIFTLLDVEFKINEDRVEEREDIFVLDKVRLLIALYCLYI